MIQSATLVNPLGFALDFLSGKAHLTLGDVRLGDIVDLVRVELEVPGVSFPFDVSGGAGRFRHRRCRLRRLVSTIGVDAWAQWCASLKELPSYGFSDLSFTWADGSVLIEGHSSIGQRVVPFTATAIVLPTDRRALRVVLSDVHCFGHLPVPPPMLASALLAAVGIGRGTATADGAAVTLEHPGIVRVELLDWILERLLPAHGWRLPETNGVGVDAVAMSDSGLRVTFLNAQPLRGDTGPVAESAASGREAAGEEAREALPEAATGDAAIEAAAAPASGPDPSSGLALIAEIDRHAEGESTLAAGDLEAALAYYRDQATREPENDFVQQRLLELLACAPATMAEARTYARKLLQARPDFLPALFVLATTAQETGETAEAASRYAAVAHLSQQRGKHREAVLATLACGRLVAESDPDQAISWYERALTLNPDLTAAVGALSDLYRARGRVQELLRLQRRFLSRAQDKGDRLRGHLLLGETYLDLLDDPGRARAEYERAVRLDGTSLAAWEGLANAYRHAADPAREIRALGQVLTLAKRAGDGDAARQVRCRMAEAWAADGDLDRALSVVSEVLDASSEDVDALHLFATLSVEAEKFSQAAEALERLVQRPDLAAAKRSAYALELARVHLSGLQDPQSAAIFVETALGADPTPEVLDLAIELAESEGRHVDLVELLERRASIVEHPEEAAALQMRRADILLGPIGEVDLGRDVLEGLAEDDGPLREEALQRLVELHRAAGRTTELTRTLQRLVEGLIGGSAPLGDADVARLIELSRLVSGTPLGDEEAKRYLRRAVAAVPSDPGPLFMLANLLRAPDEQDEREGLLQRVAALAEEHDDGDSRVGALRELGLLRLAQGRREEAFSALGAAAEISPQDPHILLPLGGLAFGLSRWDVAERAFGALWAMPEEEPDGEEGGADWSPTAHRALVALRLAELKEKRGDHEAAVEMVREALACGAKGEVAAACHRLLQDVLSREGRWAEVSESLQAVGSDPTALPVEERTSALFAAAEIERRQLHNAEAARRLCTWVLTMKPDHLGALNALEALTAEMADWLGVARIIERKLELLAGTESAAELLENLADVYRARLGRRQGARRTYERLLAYSPDHRGALYFIAQDAFAEGDHDGAATAYERLLALGEVESDDEPDAEDQLEIDWLAVHHQLAQIARARDRPDEVENHLRQMLELDSANEVALEALDQLFDESAQWGRLAEMIRLRAEREKDPDRAAGHLLRLAHVWADRAERIDEALDVAREALRRSPNNAVVMTSLADLLRRSRGEPGELRRLLERMLELHDGGVAEGLPPRGELLSELGTLLRSELAEPAAGAELLREAQQMGWRDVGLLRALAEVASQDQTWGELEQILGELAELTTDAAERTYATLEQARLRLDALGDAEGALEVLRTLGGAERPDGALSLSARIHEALEDWNQAYLQYAEVAARAEKRGDVDSQLDALERMLFLAAEPLGNPEAVQKTAEQILEREPDNEDALGRLAAAARDRRSAQDLIAVLGRHVAALGDDEQTAARRAELWYEQARVHLLVFDGEAAKRAAKEALELDDSHERALRALAVAMGVRGDFVGVADALEQLLVVFDERDDGDEGVARSIIGLHRERAEVCAGPLGDYARARESLRGALERAAHIAEPTQVELLESWARLAAEEMQWGEVAEAYQRLRELRSEVDDALALADAYERALRVDDAIRAIRAAPKTTDAGQQQRLRDRERELLVAAGRYSDLGRALEEDAKKANAAERPPLLLDAADHYLRRAGDAERAERCLVAVLEMAPTTIEALRRLPDCFREGRPVSRLRKLVADVAESVIAFGDASEPPPAERAEVVSMCTDIVLDTVESAGEDGDRAVFDQAIRWLGTVVRWVPDRDVDVERITALLRQQKRHDELVALLADLQETPALDVEVRWQLALDRAAALATDLERAPDGLAVLAALRESPERPDNPDLGQAELQLRVSLFEGLKRWEEAEATLLELADFTGAVDPEITEFALRRAADLAERRGAPADRRAHLWLIIERGHLDPEILEELASSSDAQGDGSGQLRALTLLAELPGAADSRATRLLDLGRALKVMQPQEAVSRLREAARLSPGRADVHLELGELARSVGEVETARLSLATAYELLPEDAREKRSEVLLARSRLELEPDGDQALSRRFARQAADETKLAGRRAEALRLVSELAQKQGDIGQEEDALRGLWDMGVARSSEMNRLAALCSDRGSWTEALKIYDHLRISSPRDASLLDKIAEARRATGDLSGAADALADAAKLAWDDDDWKSASRLTTEAALLLEQAGDTPERILDLLELALQRDVHNNRAFGLAAKICRGLGDPQRLIRLWEKRIPVLAPMERTEAYVKMAQLAEEDLEDRERAASLWALGLAASGNQDIDLLERLLAYHTEVGDHEIAWDYGERLLAVGGPSPERAFEVHTKLAALGAVLGHTEGVRRHLRLAHEMNPKAGDVAAQLETIYTAEQSWLELVDLLAARARGEEESVRAQSLAKAGAIAYQELGQIDRAIELYEEAVAWDPSNGEARQRYAALLREAERWDRLQERLEAEFKLARGPERAELADDIAEIAEEKTHDPEAAQRYRRLALLSAPADVRRLRALVDILAKQRQWTELVELLDEAVDTMILDSDSASGFFALLGRTYLEKIDRPDLALDVFERARKRRALTERSGELLADLYESNARFVDLADLLDELAQRYDESEGTARPRLLVKRARVLADHLGRPADAAEILLELFRESPERRRRLARMARELLTRARLYAEALGVIGEELACSPEDEHVSLLMDRARLLEVGLRQPDDALLAYRRVLERAPEFPPAHLAVARLGIDQLELEEALAHAVSALRGTGDDAALSAEAHELAGEILEELDRTDEAVEHLERAIALDPTSLTAVQRLSRLYTAVGDWAKLASTVGKEILLTTEAKARGRLWFRRALLYRDMLDREADALRCLREAVAADPGNSDAISALQGLAATQGDWETSLSLIEKQLASDRLELTQRWRLILRRAEILADQLKSPDQAIAGLRQALAGDGPKDRAAMRKLADLLAAQQSWTEAARIEKIWAEGAKEARERAEGLLRAADHYERVELLEDSTALLFEVLQADDPQLIVEAANRLVARDRPAEAKLKLAELMEARAPRIAGTPARRGFLRQIISLYTEAGHDERAEGFVAELFAEDPSDRTAFQHRTRFLEERGDWTTLGEMISQRLAAAPADEQIELLLRLARVQLEHLKDSDAAAQTYDQILLLEPDHIAAVDARADLAWRAQEFTLAEQLYERLAGQGSSLELGRLLTRRGHIAEALGRDEEAARHFEAALQAQPDLLEALEPLARLHLFAGRDLQAREVLERLVEALPHGDQERRIAARVQLARTMVRLGQSREAAEQLQSLLAVIPHSRALLESLAEAQRAAGLWEGLALTLGQLADVTQDSKAAASILYAQGEVLQQRLGQRDRAASGYLKALDLDPRNPVVMARVVGHYAREGRWDALMSTCAEQQEVIDEMIAEGRGDANELPRDKATAQLGRAVGALLAGGTSAADAPKLVREVSAPDLLPSRAARVLGDVAAGLEHAHESAMSLSKVFDLLDSAFGRSFLPRCAEAGERLQQTDITDLGLRRMLARLCARLGDGNRATCHQNIIAFLQPDADIPGGGPAQAETLGHVAYKVLDVFGPALPEGVRVPLRTLLTYLHPHLGLLGPPIKETSLGAEIGDLTAPRLAAALEDLRGRMRVGPVGAVFARSPRRPIEVVFAMPPVLLIDRELENRTLPEMYFLVARALELCRSGSLILFAQSEAQVAAAVSTVARMFDIPLPKSEVTDPDIEARLRQGGFGPHLFDSETMEAMQVAFFNHFREPTGIRTYRVAEIEAADRLGLLACGRLTPSLNALTAQLKGFEALDADAEARRMLLRREPELSMLAEFGASSLYRQLSRHRTTRPRI